MDKEMLFTSGEAKFESYKERNLYYKFFAGYFFNDLIEGCEQRIDAFYKLLKKPYQEHGRKFPDVPCPHPSQLEVSFDNHGAQWGIEGRGEFADILLCDKLNKLLIAIEVKYLTDWDFQKDICDNSDRIQRVFKQKSFNGWKPPVQCLLLLGRKWENGSGKRNRDALSNSQYSILVIHWEQFVKATENKNVRSYLERQLKRERVDFKER